MTDNGLALYINGLDGVLSRLCPWPEAIEIATKKRPGPRAADLSAISGTGPGKLAGMVSRPSPESTRRGKLSDGFAYPPRGMDADQAAAYVGLGRTKFLEMVKVGHMPKPLDLDGSTRWDRLDLDHKMDDLKETRQNPSTASRSRINARLDEQERETEHETRIALRPKR
jgi:predicted DNA-binding transcriptional regulator AlpA